MPIEHGLCIEKALKVNYRIQYRLIALGLALSLMGALIVVVVISSHRQAAELRAHLQEVDLESFGLADHLKDRLREVNDKLRAYRNSHEPGAWEDFLKSSHELEAWVDQQGSRLNTEQEKRLLREFDAAYQDYLQLAETLQAHLASESNPTDKRPDVTGFVEHNRRLSDLGQALAKAHYESRNQLLARANRTLTDLRFSILGLLALLFLTGIALAGVVYRQMIAPLRTQLGESIALAQRNEKLASLGLMAAGVAHEIRNPLTALKAALFIQQKKLQPGSPERSDSEVVEREIVRLERIVNDFLQFARPAEPEFETIAADLPLQEVERLLGAHLAKTGIRLVRETSPALRIRADASQLKQVLINLVQNAADSIQGEGIITLRARHDRKHITNGEINVVVLEVTDTGGGIPPEVEARLFDPFFTTKCRGTGLGLPIAARIVEKNGGMLQYQTRLCHGTTFSIVMPEVSA